MSYPHRFSGYLVTRMTVPKIHLEVTSTHQKKLDNLSKQQERHLFNVHDTVRLFELNIHRPKYVLDTLGTKGTKEAHFGQV